MKPPPFDYVAATTLDEAADALAEPGAMVLAGGQSLLLELAYRQQRPSLLVDINRVPGLDAVEEGPAGLTLGALVRHRQLERAPAGSVVRELLARVAPYVAHPPIRNRGTFCGSIAWAHPAAEWNAVAVAFDADVQLRSRRGARVVPAADFYRGSGVTSRRPDELIRAVRLPPVPPGTGTGFAEHRRTHASFAEIAVVAALSSTEGVVDWARLGVAGAADRPLRLVDVERQLAGLAVAEAADRVRLAVPTSLPVTTSDYHRAVTAELAGRAVEEAVSGR